MIQCVSRGLRQESELLDCILFPLPTTKIIFELTLAVLDRPIVSGRIRGTVNRDNISLLQYLVDRQMIEIAAIV